MRARILKTAFNIGEQLTIWPTELKVVKGCNDNDYILVKANNDKVKEVLVLAFSKASQNILKTVMDKKAKQIPGVSPLHVRTQRTPWHEKYMRAQILRRDP